MSRAAVAYTPNLFLSLCPSFCTAFPLSLFPRHSVPPIIPLYPFSNSLLNHLSLIFSFLLFILSLYSYSALFSSIPYFLSSSSIPLIFFNFSLHLQNVNKRHAVPFLFCFYFHFPLFPCRPVYVSCPYLSFLSTSPSPLPHPSFIFLSLHYSPSLLIPLPV